jgi:hypothetical protein
VPDGYGWLQLECAQRRGMRVLQWRNPELDLSGIDWSRHRELLELDMVQATSLETFKKAVLVALLPPPPPSHSRSTGDQPLVFLNTEARHGDIAAKIRDAIRDRAALVEPLREGAAEEVRVDAPAQSKPELCFSLPEMVIIDGRNGIGPEAMAQLSQALRL